MSCPSLRSKSSVRMRLRSATRATTPATVAAISSVSVITDLHFSVPLQPKPTPLAKSPHRYWGPFRRIGMDAHPATVGGEMPWYVWMIIAVVALVGELFSLALVLACFCAAALVTAA